MQKIMLITVPMIILGAAVYITSRLAGGPPGGKQGITVVLKPMEDNGGNSSPIIVGDGSINVRQFDNLIHEIDNNHAYITETNHTAVSVTYGTCGAPTPPEHDTPWASCTPSGISTSLTAHWNIQLNDSSGNVMGNIGASDPNFKGLIMFSTVDLAHTMVGREPDNGGDGEGFVECAAGASKCTAGLNSATITLNSGSSASTTLCPSVASGSHCILRIRYCNPTAVGDGSCK
jgi:hypothetical protein